MSVIKANGAGDQSTGVYNDVATQSLRMDYGSNPNLNITHSSSPTNTAKGTLSFWYKRGGMSSHTGHHQYIIHTSAGTSDNGHMDLKMETSDEFSIGAYGTTPFEQIRKLRDGSSWYHVVVAFDSTSGTASERLIKVYINSELQTNSSTNNAVAQNQQFPWTNASQAIYIGRHATVNRPMDGYLAEWNLIDGQALDPTSFGETKNGIWIPKEYSGSYGNNGVRLEFKNTSVGSGSSSTIGADTSGETNHWTSSGIAAHDCNIPDSPENNFATLNYISSGLGVLSEGNLKYVSTSDTGDATLGISSGKFYAEVYVNAGSNSYVGVHDIGNGLSPTRGGGFGSHGAIAYKQNGDQYSLPVGGSSATASYGATYTSGDIISIAVDIDGDTVTFYKNGSSQGNTTNGVSHVSTGSFYSLIVYGNTFTVNFGQDSSFLGVKTAQGNTDSEGFGDFYYTPPSGYLALCSANLTEPTIGPNSGTQADNHFDITLYTGNSGNKTISGFNFQPDWVWGKARSVAHNHHVHDSSRGVENRLVMNNTDIDYGDGALKTFTSDGYTFDTAGAINTNNETYVNWVWHCDSGSTSSNSDGSITSTVQVNTTAGFSIVLFTGNGSTNQSVGHGLGGTPQMALLKSRTGTGRSWVVTHQGLTGSYKGIKIDSANAQLEDSSFYLELASSTVGLAPAGTPNTSVNENNKTFVMYVFKDVEGYSRFGRYTGNDNANGTFVYTGFRPAFVLIKNVEASAEWRISDSTRQPHNDEGGHILFPSGNYVENTSEYDMDFLSNGFKLRSGDLYENGSSTIIYMAFAEQPFKYANAK